MLVHSALAVQNAHSQRQGPLPRAVVEDLNDEFISHFRLISHLAELQLCPLSVFSVVSDAAAPTV